MLVSQFCWKHHRFNCKWTCSVKLQNVKTILIVICWLMIFSFKLPRVTHQRPRWIAHKPNKTSMLNFYCLQPVIGFFSTITIDQKMMSYLMLKLTTVKKHWWQICLDCSKILFCSKYGVYYQNHARKKSIKWCKNHLTTVEKIE